MSGACTTLSVSSSASVNGALTVSGGINSSGLLTQTGQSFFQDVTFNGVSTFAYAPALSGASINSGTIQSGSVSGDCITLNNIGNQTKTQGNITFSNLSNLIVTNPIVGSVSNVQVTDNGSSPDNHYFCLIDQPSGYGISTSAIIPIKTDGGVFYTPITRLMTFNNVSISGTLTATLTGLASRATSVVLSTGSGATNYLTFSTTSTGTSSLTTDSLLNYNQTTSTLSAKNVTCSGAVTANGIVSSITAAPSSDRYIGYLSSNITLPFTQSNNNSTQVCGTGSTYLNSSSQYGVYMVFVNIAFTNIVSGGYFTSSYGQTLNVGSGFGCSITYPMQLNGTTLNQASYSFVINYFSTATKWYIVNTMVGTTFSVNNSIYQYMRIA